MSGEADDGPGGGEQSSDLFDRWEKHRTDAPGTTGPERAARPAPRHARPVAPDTTSAPASSAEDGTLDSVAASRDVMAALGLGDPAVVSPPAVEPGPEPVPEPVVDVSAHRAAIAPALGPSTDVVFKPKVLVRRVLGLLSVALFAATCYAGYLAYDDRTQTRVGIMIGLGLVTLFVWAIIVSSPVTYLAIRSGQLEVRRGALHQVFDLRSRYTPVQVVGHPGSPGWKVVLGRLDHPPLVIDGGMVNGKQFGAALEQARPSAPPPQ